ncbi:MAG TPA: histidine kinase, partial [Isosphaeraceae bacterium]
MPQWPIRVKLIAGLSLVVGMMLTLMGGSIFGLRAFHDSNLTLTDQLRELGASKRLLQLVVQLETVRADTNQGRRELGRKVRIARDALATYFNELKKNAIRGNRADPGADEAGLAFQIDADLTAMLAELDPAQPIEHVLRGTPTYISRHPEAVG